MGTANLTMDIREVVDGVRVIDVTGEITAFSEQEITDAFSRERARLPKRPATVTFRQIVVSTTASEAAKKVAAAKGDGN